MKTEKDFIMAEFENCSDEEQDELMLLLAISPDVVYKDKGWVDRYSWLNTEKNIFDTKSFIKKSKKVHENLYDYSKVDYRRAHKKIIIICKKHGEFEQVPKSHLKGHGCPECSDTKKLDTKSFIEKAKEIHGDKYDYSKVNYKGSKEKVIIICKIHGEFEQTPNNHLEDRGCPDCSKNKKIDFTKKQVEQWLKDITNGKTKTQLSKENNCNQTTISNYIKKYHAGGRD